MPQLTVNYSEALAELIHSNDVSIDGIEVGPWFTPEKIERLQQAYPGLPFQFHAGSFITRYQYRHRALARLREYQACTQSRWVSLHIELLPVQVFVLGSHFGLHLPPPKIEKAKRKFLRLLSEIQAAFEEPVILEHLPAMPQAKYAYAANPAIIREIVETTGCGFLLDIAHARAAASYQRMKVEHYLEALPLERVRQVHVSGVREKGGYLHDAHEAMREEDYATLAWVLERSEPEVVTLEYYRELEPLREQLRRLRAMGVDG